MKVLYFAWLRDRVGVAEEVVDPPGDIKTVGQLAAWLAQRSPGHAEAFADPAAVRCAVNQDFARAEEPFSTDDEIAFFPPMTGG
ncbi:MAG: molybdopterin converting factor subunit 1 [Rhodospirillaceae bacterium]|jgi:sulfur-carrier protein|nr:molybdopterin converting factor subunit 1 [Rhodospirillaceae bacterium]MBT4488849.1 molybdopterin converting factor subunit 1 [Rhodospirillaceae bacterium]MBT5194682.1 molybdopterin converting factor subunit 1 [Rhodospirillaceae bacterium]MBT5896200.1 molybdopterin converting factor subunit 1 [Rhodospirillaceae bacterium]MBT6429761.1 molybdopterin converting factor subunit 1 [Rhodospirillaceae bacterium]